MTSWHLIMISFIYIYISTRWSNGYWSIFIFILYFYISKIHLCQATSLLRNACLSGVHGGRSPSVAGPGRPRGVTSAPGSASWDGKKKNSGVLGLFWSCSGIFAGKSFLCCLIPRGVSSIFGRHLPESSRLFSWRSIQVRIKEASQQRFLEHSFGYEKHGYHQVWSMGKYTHAPRQGGLTTCHRCMGENPTEISLSFSQLFGSFDHCSNCLERHAWPKTNNTK